MSVEYSDAYMGECSGPSCALPATVRIHKDWIVCALHYEQFLTAEVVNEESLAAALIAPWRAEAEYHGCLGLAAAIDRYAEGAREAEAEAAAKMERMARIALESGPEHETRMRTGGNG